MASQAPADAVDHGVRPVNAREGIDVLLRSTGGSAGPGNGSCLPARVSPAHRSPLRREPHAPGTGSDLQVTVLAVCESSRMLACLIIGPRT